MTVNQLRYFLALCAEKSFTLAARRCAISQPSLTNAIRMLEDEIGGTLFHRKPHARLTCLGRTLRPHFKSIVNAVDKTPRIAATFIADARRRNGAALPAKYLGAN